MKKVKRLLFLFALFSLAGCIPENKTRSSSEDIVQTTIAGQTFRIPKNYLFDSNPQPVAETAKVLVMYPDFKPPKEKPTDLEEKGEWYKNIRIIFTSDERIKLTKRILEATIKTLDAHKVVGKQYGLIYRTQEDGDPKDWGELWIEQDAYPAHILCSEKNDKIDEPQCKHLFAWKRQTVRIIYDKRLLPHWREIKENAIKLLEEFEVEITEPAEPIIQTTIAGQTFRIPKSYLYQSRPEPVDDTAMILVMYPDFKPPTERPNVLWKKGEWYRKVRVFFMDQKRMKPLKESLLGTKDTLDAHKVVGKEYGLIYYTQEDGNPKDWGKLWIEQEGYPAYIQCSEKILETDTPQCGHLFLWKKLTVRISYDKRLLPHWKEIKLNVIKILEEFEVETSNTSMEGQE